MISVIEPATEAVLAEIPRAGVDEVNAAVARAREAFPAMLLTAPTVTMSAALLGEAEAST